MRRLGQAIAGIVLGLSFLMVSSDLGLWSLLPLLLYFILAIAWKMMPRRLNGFTTNWPHTTAESKRSKHGTNHTTTLGH